jgi:hypothetical protein
MKEKKKCSDNKTAAKPAILLHNEQFPFLLERRQRQLWRMETIAVIQQEKIVHF